jgi:hypothetical protein
MGYTGIMGKEIKKAVSSLLLAFRFFPVTPLILRSEPSRDGYRRCAALEKPCKLNFDALSAIASMAIG